MNQVLKRSVYQRGTQAQIDMLAELGGMNEQEYELFSLLHKGKDDNFIIDSMGLSKSSYRLVEEAMRAKLLVALFECINFTRDNMNL